MLVFLIMCVAGGFGQNWTNCSTTSTCSAFIDAEIMRLMNVTTDVSFALAQNDALFDSSQAKLQACPEQACAMPLKLELQALFVAFVALSEREESLRAQLAVTAFSPWRAERVNAKLTRVLGILSDALRGPIRSGCTDPTCHGYVSTLVRLYKSHLDDAELFEQGMSLDVRAVYCNVVDGCAAMLRLARGEAVRRSLRRFRKVFDTDLNSVPRLNETYTGLFSLWKNFSEDAVVSATNDMTQVVLASYVPVRLEKGRSVGRDAFDAWRLSLLQLWSDLSGFAAEASRAELVACSTPECFATMQQFVEELRKTGLANARDTFLAVSVMSPIFAYLRADLAWPGLVCSALTCTLCVAVIAMSVVMRLVAIYRLLTAVACLLLLSTLTRVTYWSIALNMTFETSLASAGAFDDSIVVLAIVTRVSLWIFTLSIGLFTLEFLEAAVELYGVEFPIAKAARCGGAVLAVAMSMFVIVTIVLYALSVNSGVLGASVGTSEFAEALVAQSIALQALATAFALFWLCLIALLWRRLKYPQQKQSLTRMAVLVSVVAIFQSIRLALSVYIQFGDSLLDGDVRVGVRVVLTDFVIAFALLLILFFRFYRLRPTDKERVLSQPLLPIGDSEIPAQYRE